MGNVMFLHRLQQGSLGFRRGPVDLIGQDHVRENGTFDEFEDALAGSVVFLEDLRAGNVGGHEIGGELDPLEAEIEDFREGVDEQSLSQARNTDEKGMGSTENGNQQLLDDFVLPHDNQVELLLHGRVGCFEFFDNFLVGATEFWFARGCRCCHGLEPYRWGQNGCQTT